MLPTSTNPKRRALFLDRDGTLNEEVGYITELAQFRLYDYAAAAVRRINQAGWLAIVLTNQSGIARGLYDEALLAQVHARMRAELAQQGARLDAIYHCPHLPPAPGESAAGQRIVCACRKPLPGMLEQAAREFALDLPASYVIGDRYGDVEAAFNAGAQGVLVLTGHGRTAYEQRAEWPRPPALVAENLLAAVEAILQTSEI